METENATTDAYHKSINQVTTFINEHLFESLDLTTLAKIANLSRFHFHRISRAITDESQCRFFIGVTIQPSVKPKGRFGVMSIPDGDYAVFRFKGEYSTLHRLYRYIYLKWLPESRYQLRNTFSFEIYINTPKETFPSDLLTDIYIPVEKQGIR